MTVPRVVLQPRHAKPFYGQHPWVFAGAIARIEGDLKDGDEVDLVSHAGDFIAKGLFNSKSKIRVRLYSWSTEIPIDSRFFRDRLGAALRLRHEILQLNGPGRAYRLVFSEADGLSGLTVDVYDRWVVVQFTALGLALRRDMIVDALEELLHPDGIYLRTERGIGHLEGLELHDQLLRGHVPSTPIAIDDGGLNFLVQIAEGQKTGFYLDQRDNRPAVAKYGRGRRVLDAFCYTGGFGIHAARAGASEVIGIDVSEPALELARENVRRNHLGNVRFVRADVFEQLDHFVKTGEHFGLIVLDPPKFARSRAAIEGALSGYRRLHQLALKLLVRGGILVTCSCSGLISVDMLEAVLAQLAVESRCEIRVLERRGQSPDHPVAVTCPESRYLKCLISHVS